MKLPIDEALPELRRVLRERSSAVLPAPPGAGKTTRVPLALLEEPWLQGKKIVMLEPRRLAARMAAGWMAAQALGRSGAGAVGGLIGYRIRRDTKVSKDTRIEVVTEGVLTRILRSDPALEAYGCVIFDEFHERSLPGDLGLALTLQAQQLLRPELRILVMSATLDGAPIAKLLGDAPVVSSEGRSFPVETKWIPRPKEQRVENAVAAAVRRALEEVPTGDILAFLPGAREIRSAASLLGPMPPASCPVDVVPLFGDLKQEEQDRAVRPAPSGRRKVVLATSIAETSLTIDGVTVVVDGGMSRVPKFSPRSGMTRLTTVRVSRASADQRRGRAGRVAPGTCYRCWDQNEERGLVPRGSPEILEADLAPLALDLAVQGTRPDELPWLDAPPAAAFAQAVELLQELGALDHEGRATAHGREIAEFGVHPRLAHMMLSSRTDADADGDADALACRLAALLEERDILRGEGGPPDPDITLRLEVLAGRRVAPFDEGGAHRVRQEAKSLQDQLRQQTPSRKFRPASASASASASGLLALAYPDRIGKRRAGQEGRFILRNGVGAFTTAPSLSRAEWIVAAELDGDLKESKIFLGAALGEDEVRSLYADQIETVDEVTWDVGAEKVVAKRVERFGAIVLSEKSVRDPDPQAVAHAVAEALAREGLTLLPWRDDAIELRARLAFLHAVDPTWPDVSDAALQARADQWLAPHLLEIRKKGDLAKLDVAKLVLEMLTWDQRKRLDDLAPTHLEVPSGSRIRVDYADPKAPVLAVKLQEVFGWLETPRLAGEKVPVTLHLLSPAQRPVQVTKDLANFWKSGYFEVRKDLRGRYPKHPWPEDPLTATPTKRAKPRGT
ncbi:MAG TPA: ATP-dependent helicase HrpB [Gemmatimonadales bacterium]|nr:ATP-dependent helicase HrpB [Gemmatimonadales bacterium]